MRLACALFVFAAVAIVSLWAWLGAPVEMPQALRGRADKLDCISYAPFRGNQNPFGPDVPIDPRQIDQDLGQLSAITDCVRTYSTDHGLDQIPEIAKRHGLKVMLGLWLSNQPELNRKQIETAVELAKRFPDVIQSVIVGNEVLLRGEMSAPALADTVRSVKTQIPVPVTYADVWEFWLRYREVAAAVDFVTVHILPYWEDVPIPADEAAMHVDAIRKKIVAAFQARRFWSANSAGRAPVVCARARCRRRRRRPACCRRWRRRAGAIIIASTSSRPMTSPGSASSRGPWAALGAVRCL